MIKDFKNFINESITLTASDKDFLWKKLEYNKKKKAWSSGVLGLFSKKGKGFRNLSSPIP